MVRSNRRLGNSATPKTVGAEPLGKVRRSQLISTYGIGAVIDLEKGSFMPMGLDDLEAVTRVRALTIKEARLEAQLGVSHFRLPPVVKELEGTLADPDTLAPAVRFPQWQECPKCHKLGREGYPFELADDGIQLRCTAHSGNVYTNPVRFVIACRAGHASDVPWEWWAHQNRDQGVCARPSLSLMSRGKSAALGDLYVFCTNCTTANSVAKIFQLTSFAKYGCQGSRPWLHDRDPSCSQEPTAIQRGASNFHFPIIASALSIPPVSKAAFQIIEDVWEFLRSMSVEAVGSFLQGQAEKWDVDVALLEAAWRERNSFETGTVDLAEGSMRAEEYSALCHDRDDPIVGGIVPHFENEVLEPEPRIAPWFDLVSAVHRLREVRALAAFSRIDPWPISPERIPQALADGRVAPLSKSRKSWLPAAEIKGEGIFLRFRSDAVENWIIANPEICGRASELDKRASRIASERGFEREYTITPRLLLVHSFAHALIRQISVDCGYSSAALRERLYVDEGDSGRPPMQGVLIYTGSPDSEGSLGGLVRLADGPLLNDIVTRTLNSARWCGSDPVCIETQPDQAGDRVSAASCHCCMLLPETACEKFNRELDRSVLVGAENAAFTGFFTDAVG